MTQVIAYQTEYRTWHGDVSRGLQIVGRNIVRLDDGTERAGDYDYVSVVANDYPSDPDVLLDARIYDGNEDTNNALASDRLQVTREFLERWRADTLTRCVEAGFDAQVIPPLRDGFPDYRNPATGRCFTYDLFSAPGIEAVTRRTERTWDPFHPGTVVNTGVRFRAGDKTAMWVMEPFVPGPLLASLLEAHTFLTDTWPEGRVLL